MTQLLTPELDVETIDVEEGLNARKHMDPDALKRLASSVKRTGVVEPIVVSPAGRAGTPSPRVTDDSRRQRPPD